MDGSQGVRDGQDRDQVAALNELEQSGFATAEAFRVKKLLCWVRRAETP
jgi:hypothetical protein